MEASDATNLSWITQPNEKVTVSETHSSTMPGVDFVVDLVKVPASSFQVVEKGEPVLTVQMGAKGEKVLTVTAHFSGTPNEQCKVTISGSEGGGASKVIRQPPNSSFGQRHFTFTVGTNA